MREVFAVVAIVVWGAGVLAAAQAARVWARAGRRRLGLVAMAGILCVELAWLVWVSARGLEAVLTPRSEGIVDGWLGWMAGAAGLAALVSGVTGAGGPRDPDRAAEIGVGLFGLGILLRQVATML